MMAALVAEFDDLIFDGRAVPGTGSFYNAGVDRRPVKVLADDLMRLFISIGQPAGNLLDLNIGRIRRIGKRDDYRVSGLDLHFGIIQSPAVHPGRRPGLEPSQRNTQPVHGILEPGGPLHTAGAGLCDGFTHQTARVQISTGTDDHSLAAVNCPGMDPDSRDPFFVQRNIINTAVIITFFITV